MRSLDLLLGPQTELLETVNLVLMTGDKIVVDNVDVVSVLHYVAGIGAAKVQITIGKMLRGKCDCLQKIGVMMEDIVEDGLVKLWMFQQSFIP